MFISILGTSGPEAGQFPQVQGQFRQHSKLQASLECQEYWENTEKNNPKCAFIQSDFFLVMGKEVGFPMYKSMCHRKAKV